MPIKVIDLFAGPGGLGEGFSAYAPKGKKAFKIAISIEKDESAHRTLLLRAFYRQFKLNNLPVPEEYYAFLRGELGKNPEDKLYKFDKFKIHLERANQEAQKLELGKDSQDIIFNKIRNVIGKDECILIGGPPCQAYSLAGRARNKSQDYNPKDDHRNFLYQEYLKVIAKFQPKIFVMENVKGILSAKIGKKLIFNSILEDLKIPHKATHIKADKGRKSHQYKIYSLVPKKDDLFNTGASIDPHDYIIKAENYGIPQARHRVILLGIREDIDVNTGEFDRLKPSENSPTVEQVLSDLPKLRSKLSKGIDSKENWREAVNNISRSKLSQLSKDPLVPNEVYEMFSSNMNKIWSSYVSIGSDKGTKKNNIKFNTNLSKDLASWYEDKRLKKFVVNHETRGHIEGDLHRYLYYSTYAKVMKKSPTSKNLPKALWPAHKNFGSGKFADRFKVQLSKSAASTVTCHISKDGHNFIHYDPKQCRSLTVREAARIQTFPDNYYFVGNRTQQYVQVGNAVPPYLANQIANIVSKIFK